MSDYFIMKGKVLPPASASSLKSADIAPDTLHPIALPDGKTAIVLRHGNDVTAYLAQCPHMGGDLTQAKYCSKDNTIRCFWHGYHYDAGSGEFTHNPNIEPMQLLRTASPCFDSDKKVAYRLQKLEVIIEDDCVRVDYAKGKL